MKRKLSLLGFVFCCALAIALTNCNNSKTTETTTETTTTPTTDENPLTDGDGYSDPAVEKVDTTTIDLDGLVFIEKTGSAIAGATYAIKDGDVTIAEGVTKRGGTFSAPGFSEGKEYEISVTADGYSSKTEKFTCSKETLKVGLSN